jgi:parallel beta-helix repeat protein
LTLKNGNNGILLERVENCLIDGNKIYGFKCTGIFVNNSIINVSITNDTIRTDNYQSNVSGITLSESSDVLIDDNDICVGHGNSHHNTDSNNYIDILLNNSFGNTIYFNGTGIIIEDTVKCGIACDGDTPMCNCDSVEDTCQHFTEMSNNEWSFKC